MAVTLKDVAKEAGVSSVTVSYVLNNKNRVSDETKERVWQAVHKLNYVPNQAAKLLSGSRTQNLCLIISGPGFEYLTNPYLYKLVKGVSTYVKNAGYSLSIKLTNEDEEQDQIHREINSHLYDGILLWGTRLPDAEFLKLFQHKLPIVSIARDHLDDSVYSVVCEYRKAAYKMTKYLLEQGRKRILFLGKLDKVKAARDRLEGYKDALASADIPYDEALIYEADYYQDDAYNIIHDAKLDNIDAIFSASDLMAMGSMKALLERNIAIPQQIAVVGFDNLPNTDMLPVALTTIDTPIEQLGSESAKLLIARLEGTAQENRIVLGTQLLIRASG